jgi:hypothetical protein
LGIWFSISAQVHIFLLQFVFDEILTWSAQVGLPNLQHKDAPERVPPVSCSGSGFELNPQGLIDVLIAGFFDPENYATGASDGALFGPLIGAVMMPVARTYSIVAGVGRVCAALRVARSRRSQSQGRLGSPAVRPRERSKNVLLYA